MIKPVIPPFNESLLITINRAAKNPIKFPMNL